MLLFAFLFGNVDASSEANFVTRRAAANSRNRCNNNRSFNGSCTHSPEKPHCIMESATVTAANAGIASPDKKSGPRGRRKKSSEHVNYNKQLFGASKRAESESGCCGCESFRRPLFFIRSAPSRIRYKHVRENGLANGRPRISITCSLPIIKLMPHCAK